MSDEQAQGYIDHLHDIHESAKFDEEMSESEFNLSDKERRLIPEIQGKSFYWKKEEDVKEAVKELKNKCTKKDEITHGDFSINDIIDEIFGEKLTTKTHGLAKENKE